jgi:nitrate reductase NapE component
MTALLYISYSSHLSEDEKLIIDTQVSKNLETVFIVVMIFGSVFWFSDIEPAEGMGFSVPPTRVERVQRDYNYKSEVKVAPTVKPKLDKITFIKYRDLPVCIFMMDERFLQTSEASKLINKIRGGGLIEAATALVLVLLMWQILGVGIDGYGFQIPIVGPQGVPHRPANGGLQQQMNHPKHGGGRITVRMPQTKTTQCSAHRPQIFDFIKNGKVDLHDCYDEVKRRASEIGCTDFECSFNRFKKLATENGKVTYVSAKEAITQPFKVK